MSAEQQAKDLLDLAAMHAEELHPDLVPYETVNGLGMRMIAHPLVHDIMAVNGIANRKYLHKSEALVKAIEAEDWHTVVFLHEKPYRCEALIEYVLGRDEDEQPFPALSISDPDTRSIVADVWTDSENIHQHIEDWMHITEGHRPGDPLILGDQDAFDALPDVIEVWRGDCDDGGWSWSTERSVAEFFCKRWDQNNDLLYGVVKKSDVFGYLTSRREFEIMARREHVTLLSRTPWTG